MRACVYLYLTLALVSATAVPRNASADPATSDADDTTPDDLEEGGTTPAPDVDAINKLALVVCECGSKGSRVPSYCTDGHCRCRHRGVLMCSGHGQAAMCRSKGCKCCWE